MPLNLLPRAAAPAAALLFLISAPGAAQVAADSTTRAKPTDSSAAGYGDSAKQAGVDTSREKAAGDSLKGGNRAADSASAPAAAVPAAPADTVLAGSCASAQPGMRAPGLLLVLFRDAATDKERTTAVTSSGGAIAGSAPGGGDYVRPSADTISTRDLADRLVQDPSVASISERTCPSAR